MFLDMSQKHTGKNGHFDCKKMKILMESNANHLKNWMGEVLD